MFPLRVSAGLGGRRNDPAGFAFAGMTRITCEYLSAHRVPTILFLYSRGVTTSRDERNKQTNEKKKQK